MTHDTYPTRIAATRRRVQGRVRRLRAARDAGLTLAELVITMSIMASFLTMFTAGMLLMFRSAGGSEAMSVAQSQINNMFLRLDKEIRYASAVSTPGTVDGDPFVEFLTTNTGEKQCTQLRLHLADDQLQRRTWTQGSGTVTPTAWIPLASDITSAQPFATLQPDGSYGFQRLRLRLTARSGGETGRSAEMDFTFTAWNTSLGATGDSVCTEGRSTP